MKSRRITLHRPVYSAFSAVALLGVLASCGGTSRAADGPAPPMGSPASLVVQNQSTSEMRIYAVASGQRVRLGSVPGLSNRTLRIPDSLVGGGRSMGFIASPLAGQQAANSFEVYVRPGDNIRITIPSRIR